MLIYVLIELQVNRAARVCAVANGGQILVTKEVYDQIANSNALRDAYITYRGAFKMKGLDFPMELFEVGLKVTVYTNF